MIYSEDNINFNLLSGTLFEEMCFDLLTRLGFHSLIWRQGGGDSGRDIEAKFDVVNPLIGKYTETWFFECKNHSAGISVDDIGSKVSWADVEKPDHLAFFLSSYPTNDCRTWLQKKQTERSYSIHLIEGKNLKQIILHYSEIIERYFVDKFERLFRSSFVDWLAAGVFPDAERLAIFAVGLDLHRLKKEEIAFLIVAFCGKIDEINDKKLLGQKIDFSSIIKAGYNIATISRGEWKNSLPQHVAGRMMATSLNLPKSKGIHTISTSIKYQKGKTNYRGTLASICHDSNFWLEILMGRSSSGEIDLEMTLVSSDDRSNPGSFMVPDPSDDAATGYSFVKSEVYRSPDPLAEDNQDKTDLL